MPSNSIQAALQCPRCGVVATHDVEAHIDGQGAAKPYRVGDIVDWLPEEISHRIEQADGYAVCERCSKDFFVRVEIDDDRIVAVHIDTSRAGYIA